MIRKKMPDIVRGHENVYKLEEIPKGHELWIEHSCVQPTVDNEIECRLCFGHNFKLDGILKTRLINTFVVKPNGEIDKLVIKSRDEESTILFIPREDGTHIFAANYDIGVLDIPHPGFEGPRYYAEYAKTIIHVGNKLTKKRLSIYQELELIPENFKHYNPGDQVELEVLYDQKALPAVKVTAVNSNDPENPMEKNTDSQGKVVFKLEEKGNWLFKVLNSDAQKKVEGEYLEKIQMASMTIMNL